MGTNASPELHLIFPKSCKEEFLSEMSHFKNFCFAPVQQNAFNHCCFQNCLLSSLLQLPIVVNHCVECFRSRYLNQWFDKFWIYFSLALSTSWVLVSTNNHCIVVIVSQGPNQPTNPQTPLSESPFPVTLAAQLMRTTVTWFSAQNSGGYK